MTAAERERLETAERAAAPARRVSQPKLEAAGAATSNERPGDAERLIGSARAGVGVAGATPGAGRTIDVPSCARAGVAAKTMAADSMNAATRTARGPHMVHTVAIQPPAVKVCSDQVVCLPPRSMGS